MENIAGKAYFLRNEYTQKLQTLAPNTIPRWGKMNVQQMIEHMADFVRISSGKTAGLSIVTPEAHLEKMRQFLASEKEFRENTPNPMLPELPYPVKQPDTAAAIAALQGELEYMLKAFEDDCEKKTINPIFGALDYEMNVQLLYKHAWHHLRQFGIAEQATAYGT